MACRGVLFALTEEQEKKVLAAVIQGDEALDEVVEQIEGAWEYFEFIRDFYQHTANANRSVIFTVDQ